MPNLTVTYVILSAYSLRYKAPFLVNARNQLVMVESKQSSNLTDEQISSLFVELDNDNDGLLSREDLQNALQKKTGLVVTKVNANHVLRLCNECAQTTL